MLFTGKLNWGNIIYFTEVVFCLEHGDLQEDSSFLPSIQLLLILEGEIFKQSGLCYCFFVIAYQALGCSAMQM